MRRVVVTGMGIVSSIGNNTQEVLASLREAKSGISRAEDYAKLGFRFQVHGAPTLDPAGAVDRRAMRFLGGGAAWKAVTVGQFDFDDQRLLLILADQAATALESARLLARSQDLAGELLRRDLRGRGGWLHPCKYCTNASVSGV